MQPEILHYTWSCADHTATVAFCGIRFTTDKAATIEAKRGAWVICPLCECRRTLLEMGLEEPPLQPAGLWTQGLLF